MIRSTNARRFVTALVAATALGSLLAGCTLFAPKAGPSPLAQVKIDKLEVPDELRQQGPGSESSSILAPTGSLPAVAATAIQQPGAPPALTIWTATDGRIWTKSDYRSTAKGAVSSLITAASTELSVVGGSRWANGVTTPFLISSVDRRHWSTVAMPESLAAGSQLQVIAVVGTRIVVIATRPGAEEQGFVRVGSSWKTARLPKLPSGQRLNSVDLAGDAKRVLLLARPAKEGSPGAVLVFSSADGGVTWPSSGVKVADDTADVAGLVEGASGWLITGAVTASGASASRPASWSSSDGSSWTVAMLPQPAESASRWDDDSDAQLDSPLAGSDGSVAAVMQNTSSAYASVWTWSGAGSWAEVGQTGPNPSSGEGGTAFPAGSGVTGVVLGARDWLRGASFAGGWGEGTVFAARSDFYNAYDSVTTVGTNVVVPLSRSTFTLRPDNSWTNSSQAKEATINAKGAVSVTAAVPPQASGIGAPVYGSRGSATVMLGFTWDGVGPLLTSGFATADGSTWTAVTGFPADGATDPSSVARVGAGWIATAGRRSGTDVGTPDHGSVFSSADGVSWVADAGDFGSGPLDTGTTDVCAAPDGTATVVGWVERSAGRYNPVAWQKKQGSWARIDIGTPGSAEGYFEHCAGDGSTLVVSGTLDGRSSLLSVDEKGRWSTRFTAPAGDDIGRPAKVSGGFVASGEHGSGGSSQPVVWLSRTGRSWTPVAVPSSTAGGTTAVAPLGKDLVVAMDPYVGHPLVVVRDIASVISERAK